MEISAGKIKLRQLTFADSHRLAALANNPKIAVNLRDGFPHPYTLADAEKFIQTFAVQEPQQIFAIDYEGEYAGNIGLHPGTDVYRKTAEIGYFLGEPYWGKGIMTQAVQLLCDYGFKSLDIVKIYAGVFEYNQASMRVLKKCGFFREAVLQKAVFKQEKLWDEIRFALLKKGV